jgi:hypothetical protein
MRKFLLLLPIMLTACATNPGATQATPPVSVISAKKPQTVIDKAADICLRNNLIIDQTSDTTVICSREAPAMAQALFGTRYGTSVRNKIQVNAFSSEGQTKAVLREWMESQNAFGQNRTLEMNSPANFYWGQSFLDAVKTEVEGK